MSWSYSGNPSSSDIDKYRFLVGDTREDEPLLSNEEITYVVNSNKDENHVLYKLYSLIADMYARDGVHRSLGPQSEDTTKRVEYYAERLTYYRKLCGALGVPKAAHSPKKYFRLGMHDNV